VSDSGLRHFAWNGTGEFGDLQKKIEKLEKILDKMEFPCLLYIGYVVSSFKVKD
jgi:hypothetical protein